MAFTLTRIERAIQDTIEDTDEYILNMGPQHPSTHGVLRLVLRCDGEIVKEIIPYFGYLHRCYSKSVEDLNYTQGVPYSDRWDYLASIANNHVASMAIEKLTGIEVPRRAEYIRVLVHEIQRVASHLFWFGTMINDIGGYTPFMWAVRHRELMVDIFEELSGARLTYHYIRPGGVMKDVTPRAMKLIEQLIREFPQQWRYYDDLIFGNEIMLIRMDNVGSIDAEKAINYGLSGPMLRAAGVKWDLRKNQPYSIYPELDFEMITREKGDCLARWQVRLDEIKQSMRMVAQTFMGLPAGPFMAKVPRNIKPPKGETYTAVEAPRGELGMYIYSDGTNKPWRMHCRSSCMINLCVLNEMSRGMAIADLIAILGSVDIVLGETDR
ncbi:MAG: NADH-quinone oxidoreductase subunit D [bacterium]